MSVEREVFPYIRVSFTELLREMEVDPRTAKSPFWIRWIAAGVFTLNTVRLNVTANQNYIQTVQSRVIARRIFASLDYRLKGKLAASVPQEITVDPSVTATGPYTIQATDVIATTNPEEGEEPLRFEARSPLVLAQGSTTSLIQIYHQTTRPETVLATTTPGGDSQKLELPFVDILPETLTLEISGVVYEPVDTFAYSSATDPHFLHVVRNDGSSYAEFGFVDSADGDQYGQIPAAGEEVRCRCATGGGSIGNVARDQIQRYIGPNDNIVSVTNPTRAQGGFEREIIENARRLAPLRIRTHDMFWNEESGRALALQVSGVLDATVRKLAPDTFDVFVMPVGGGEAGTQLLESVRAKLLIHSECHETTLSVRSVQYLSQVIIGRVQMFPERRFDEWLPYIRLAAALRAHETFFYIKEFYSEAGLAATIDLINGTFATLLQYTYELRQDGPVIRKLLEELPAQRAGDFLANSDISEAIVAGLRGAVDFVEMTSPRGIIRPAAGQYVRPTEILFTEGLS